MDTCHDQKQYLVLCINQCTFTFFWHKLGKFLQNMYQFINKMHHYTMELWTHQNVNDKKNNASWI